MIIIHPQKEWLTNQDPEGASRKSCVVEHWDILNVVINGDLSQFLFGTVVSDYKGRFKPGDYVFTSTIDRIDLVIGRVLTRNSEYSLSGRGTKLSASPEEAFKVKHSGVSLWMIRAADPGSIDRMEMDGKIH